MLTFEQFHKLYVLNELLGYSFYEPESKLSYASEFRDTDINEKNVSVVQRAGELTVCGFKLTNNNRDVKIAPGKEEKLSQIIMKSGKKSYENPDKITYNYIPVIDNKEQALKDLIDRFASVTVKYSRVVSGKVQKADDFIFNRLNAIIPLPSSSGFSTTIAYAIRDRIYDNYKNKKDHEFVYIDALKKLTAGDLRNIDDNELKKLMFKSGANFDKKTTVDIFNDIKKFINDPNVADYQKISSKRISGHPYKSSILKHPLRYNDKSAFIPDILSKYKMSLNEMLRDDRYRDWWVKDLTSSEKKYLNDYYFKANINNGLDIAICDDDKVTGSTQSAATHIFDGIKQEITNMFQKIDFNPNANDNRYQIRLHKFYAFCVESSNQ